MRRVQEEDAKNRKELEKSLAKAAIDHDKVGSTRDDNIPGRVRCENVDGKPTPIRIWIVCALIRGVGWGLVQCASNLRGFTRNART